MKAKYKIGEIITLKPGAYIPVDIENCLCSGQLNDFTNAIIEGIREYNSSVTGYFNAGYFVRVLGGEFTNRITWVPERMITAKGDYCDEDIDVVDISELL